MRLSAGKPKAAREGLVGSRAAFTLVELLVVVAIISVLAALLLPMMQRSRNLAYTVDCLSTLRQWQSAMTEYANDHGEWLPSPGEDVAHPETRWCVLLTDNHYVSRWGPYLPSVTQSNWYRGGWCKAQKGPSVFSYAMNQRAGNFRIGALAPKTAILLDSIDCWVIWAYYSASAIDWVHNGGANFTFLDGHVETVIYGRGMDPADPRWGMKSNGTFGP